MVVLFPCGWTGSPGGRVASPPVQLPVMVGSTPIGAAGRSTPTHEKATPTGTPEIGRQKAMYRCFPMASV